MELLVGFGACLVAYCGYLAMQDAVREWKLRKLARPVCLERENTYRRQRIVRYASQPAAGRSTGGAFPGRLHRTAPAQVLITP